MWGFGLMSDVNKIYCVVIQWDTTRYPLVAGEEDNICDGTLMIQTRRIKSPERVWKWGMVTMCALWGVNSVERVSTREQRRHLLGNGPCGHRATAAILTLKVSNPGVLRRFEWVLWLTLDSEMSWWQHYLDNWPDWPIIPPILASIPYWSPWPSHTTSLPSHKLGEPLVSNCCLSNR